MEQRRGVNAHPQTEFDMEKIGLFDMVKMAYTAIGSVFNVINITARAGEKTATALDEKADELLQSVRLEKQKNLAALQAEYEAWEAAEAAKKLK